MHIERNGKSIRLNTFMTEDVVNYLEISFAVLKKTVEFVIKPKTVDVVVAKIDGEYFTIYARDTHIEITFNENAYENAKAVIDTVVQWKQFSTELDTFYVTVSDKNTITIIFENGYIPESEYKQRYKKLNPIITHFKK